MKKLQSLLLLFVLLTNTFVYGQQENPCVYMIEGQVFDLATKEPLPFASISIEGTQKGTVTNEEGYFYLSSICQEEFDLLFNYIGYKKVVHHHDIHHKLPKIYLAPDNMTLQSVIIEGEDQTGELFTGTVSHLSNKHVSNNSTTTLGDLVDKITGVSVIKSGQNVSKPVIHGLHSNRILIINNGVRHAYQSWGQEHAPEIDPSQAEHIEVIKGAATVRYGPDALGGVILVNPARMNLLDPLNGSAGVTVQSNGRAAEGDFLIKHGFHKVAVLAEGAYQRQGDLKAPDYYLTNTGKKEFSYGLGVRYHIKNMELIARYSNFHQELGILRGSVTGNLTDLARAMQDEPPAGTSDFSYEIQNPRQEVDHHLFKLNTEITGEKSIYQIQYSFQKNHRREFDIRRGTNNENPSIDLMMQTHIIDADWKHSEYKGWYGTLGTQVLYQDNDNIPGTNTIPYIPNFNNYRVGAFIIETKDFENITLEWGLRYDFQYSSIRSSQPKHQSNPVFQNVTATAGFKTKIGKGTLSSNIGSSWRPPSVSELYAFGKHQNVIEFGLLRYYLSENGGIMFDKILDEDQHPIISEKGFKWINTLYIKSDKWEGELTVYGNYIQNYIYTRPAGITTTTRGPFPFFLHDQTDALLAGADISIFYKHNRAFTSQVNASYLYAKDVKRNDYFLNMPQPELGYELEYEKATLGIFEHFEASMSVNYTFMPLYYPRTISVDEILNANNNGVELFNLDGRNFDFISPPEGYLLMDLSIMQEIEDFTVGFQVNNILNNSYRSYTDRMKYFADDTGRNIIFSVKYNFSSP